MIKNQKKMDVISMEYTWFAYWCDFLDDWFILILSKS
jgi:hypothetical protein